MIAHRKIGFYEELKYICIFIKIPFCFCCRQTGLLIYPEMGILQVLKDFAGGTSIHGFGYLVSPKSSSWTKIIWAISIFVAMMYATLEMRNSVNGKYHLQSRKD